MTAKTMPRSNPPLRRPGFTLIEMLVIIAIIGILLALLLPVLSKGKNKAGQILDLNNLRQQTQAIGMYSSDNNDVIPGPNWDNGDSAQPGWLYTADLTKVPPKEFRVETGLFWPILHNPKLYLCSIDDPANPEFGQRPQQISSYGMNGAVVGYARTLPVPVKLSAMNPDDCALWETDETHPNYFNDGANYPAEGVSGRHSQGGVQATFSGSVNYIKLEKWYEDEKDTNRNRLWCYPASVNGR
jgi:prepilin-type N-terminal cleavage/methylation domain-containing protein